MHPRPLPSQVVWERARPPTRRAPGPCGYTSPPAARTHVFYRYCVLETICSSKALEETEKLHDFSLDCSLVHVRQMIVVYLATLPVLIDKVFELDCTLQAYVGVSIA